MNRSLARVARFLGQVEDALAGLTLTAVLVIVMYELVARGIFGHSNLWTDELARVLLIMMTYVAAVGLARDGANVRVELFVTRLPPAGQLILERLTDLLCLAFAATAAWLGTKYVIESAAFGISFAHSDLPFPVWVAQAVVPICFALMSLRLVLRLIGIRPAIPVASVEA